MEQDPTKTGSPLEKDLVKLYEAEGKPLPNGYTRALVMKKVGTERQKQKKRQRKEIIG